MRRFANLYLLTSVLALAWPGYVSGGQASYPSQSVELVVPFAPGGITDLAARVVADFLSREWKQPINVVNKLGGTGVVAVMYVLRGKPDGYTMLMHAVSTGTLNPAMQSGLPYKWDAPALICRTNVSPIVFIVKGDSPWKSLRDLGDAVKREPAKFSAASGAAGGPSTFASAMFLKHMQVRVKDVPIAIFDGGALAANAVAGGHATFAAQNLPEVLGLIRSGHLRALAVTTPQRMPQLSSVPTTTEAGFPEINIMGWSGIAGPANLPPDVVKVWADGCQKISGDEAFAKKMADLATMPSWLGPQDFRNFIAREYEAMRSLADELGLRK